NAPPSTTAARGQLATAPRNTNNVEDRWSLSENHRRFARAMSFAVPNATTTQPLERRGARVVRRDEHSGRRNGRVLVDGGLRSRGGRVVRADARFVGTGGWQERRPRP